MIIAGFRLHLGLVIAAIALTATFAHPANAMQGGQPAPRVTASLGRESATVGEGVRFEVTVENADEDVAPPTMPRLDGAEIRYVTQQSFSSTQIINGRMTQRRSLTFIYEVTPLREGELLIPSLTITVDGGDYQTDPLVLSAHPPRAREDLRFRVDVSESAPFLGEPVRLTITLYVQQEIALRGFQFPDLRSNFEVYNAPAPSDSLASRTEWFSVLGERTAGVLGQAELDGQLYQTVTMTKYLVPTRTGEITIGPALLSCEILRVRRSRLLDRRVGESVIVPSNELNLDVRPLPEEGRPADFSGLVGRYRISATARPVDVNVGDPISLRIEVRPDGPVLREPAMDLRSDSEFVRHFRVSSETPEPERGEDVLVYRRTIRAQSEDVEAIPSVRLSYFDPEIGAYEFAASDPIPLSVRSTRVVTADDAMVGAGEGPAGVGVEDVTGGIAYNYAAPDALVDQRFTLAGALRRPAWLAVVAGPPVIYAVVALALAIRRRDPDAEARRRRRGALGRAQRALDDAKRREGVDRLDAISRVVYAYVGERFDRPVAGLTTDDAAAVVANVDSDLAPALREVMDHVDAARYGGLTTSAADELVHEVDDLLRRIDEMARRKKERGR